MSRIRMTALPIGEGAHTEGGRNFWGKLEERNNQVFNTPTKKGRKTERSVNQKNEFRARTLRRKESSTKQQGGAMPFASE